MGTSTPSGPYLVVRVSRTVHHTKSRTQRRHTPRDPGGTAVRRLTPALYSITVQAARSLCGRSPTAPVFRMGARPTSRSGDGRYTHLWNLGAPAPPGMRSDAG